MGSITLRIRQLTPGYFSDYDMSLLTAETRLVYVGLMCAADDDGYLPWRPDELAMAILPYEPHDRAVAAVKDAVVAIRTLKGKSRIVFPNRCRRHIHLTNLTEYQRYAKSTHNVTRHHREHMNECLKQTVPGPGARPKEAVPHGSPTEAPHGSVRYGTVRSGSDRDVTSLPIDIQNKLRKNNRL